MINSNKNLEATTLIEMLITLSLLSIIILSSSMLYSFKNIKSLNQVNQQLINKISDLLTYSTIYCVKDDVLGTIYYDYKTRQLKFSTNHPNEELKKNFLLDIPKGYDLTIKSSTSKNLIEINQKGEFKEAGSMSIKDNNSGNLIKISLGVRVFHVNIKKT